MKVIIADDSLTIRRILSGMLEKIGLTDCLTADGGDVVMELLDKHDDVGLILLDWRMPVMDGIACLRAIRAREATRKIPVVMITSEVTLDRIRTAAGAGATHYLVKPFDEAKFHSVVCPLIGKSAGEP